MPSYCFSFLNMQICYLLVSRSSLPTLVSAKLLKFQNNPELSRSFFELQWTLNIWKILFFFLRLRSILHSFFRFFPSSFLFDIHFFIFSIIGQLCFIFCSKFRDILYKITEKIVQYQSTIDKKQVCWSFNINFTPIYQESDFDRALDSLQTNTRWLRRSGDVNSLPKRKCVAIFLSIEFFDWYILKKTLLIYQSHLEISDIYIIFNMANSVTETPIFSGGELNNLLFCCPKIEERKCSNWIG